MEDTYRGGDRLAARLASFGVGLLSTATYEPPRGDGLTLGAFGRPSARVQFLGTSRRIVPLFAPFVVQPLQAAFESIDRRAIEAAWTLGASPAHTFVSIVLPQIRRGLVTAIVLGFAHTLGEFGVVLMVGGNIPGETQVISVAIYEQVELLNYDVAGVLSTGLLVFSFVVLVAVYATNRRWSVRVGT